MEKLIAVTKDISQKRKLKSEKRDESYKAIIEVQDTGKGMKKEVAQKVLEPFRQKSKGITRTHEGLGIGLSITKKIVDIFKGELRVQSEIKAGARVTIELNGSY